MDEVIEGFAGEVRVVGLREEGNDGDAGVATDDGDGLVGGIGVLDLGEKAGGADDVEGGDAEKTFGIIDALGLENFGADGNGRVDLGGGFSRLWSDGDRGRRGEGGGQGKEKYGLQGWQ